MKRIAIVSILVLLLGIGGLFAGYKVLQGNRKAPMWVPIVCQKDVKSEEMDKAVEKVYKELSKEEVLTKVVREMNLVKKWDAVSEDAAIAELKKRMFVRIGTHDVEMGVKSPAILVGVSGKKKDMQFTGEVAMKLMEFVWPVLGIEPPKKP